MICWTQGRVLRCFSSRSGWSEVCDNRAETGDLPNETFLRHIPIHWLTFAGLVIYGAVLTFITGDTGFQADDWWMLSVPYWNRLPWSVWQYIIEFRRPLDGVPWLLLYPVLGFNRIAFNLIALIFLAGASLFMGMSLSKAFPGRRAFVASSMLCSFFIPTVCPLTYVFHMDNIWLCAFLFWSSVVAFQGWSETDSSPRGLVLPVVLYYLSTLTYDGANFLIFLVPLFVWPCRQRNRAAVSDTKFWLRLSSGLVIGFVALLITRFVLFDGGAVRRSALVPSAKLAYTYLTNVPDYLLAPFQSAPLDAWAIGAGLGIMAFSAAFLFWGPGRAAQNDRVSDGQRGLDTAFLLLWAAGIIALGTYPYLMAGYGVSLGFHGEGRVYSMASFGMAIVFGLATTVWRRRGLLFVAKLAAVIVLGFMAMFHVDLRRSWQEAARINCGLWTSLSRQVPDVAPGTAFLFLDLQSYVSNRAIIFGGVHGLREFIRIFYHRRDITAHYLYLDGADFVDSEQRKALVSPQGIVARGVLPTKPLALNTLLIAARVGNRLVLLDKIKAYEKLAAIKWKGVSEIRSNFSRVLPGRPGVPFDGVCCRRCGR